MSKVSYEGFRRVTKEHPCPVCGKGHWCLVSKDGKAAICPRTSRGAAKYLRGTGYLHRLDNGKAHLKKIKKKIHRHKKNKSCITKKPSRVTRTTRRQFIYTDERGNKLFRAVRVDYPNKSKKVWQERFENGKWKRGTTDPRTKKPLVRKTLYHLPELLDPGRFNEAVFIVEGEKKVELLRKAGFLATCNPGGAGKWYDEYSLFLRDRDVVILPDNDGPGRGHAWQVRDSLIGKAYSIRIVELPSLPESGDIIDWFEQHGKTRTSFQEFEQIVENTEPISEDKLGDQPILLKMSDVECETTEWLWDKRIALGELNLIAGNPGLGKSFLTLDIAANISRGSPMPGSRLRRKKRSVILLSAEDHPAKTIRPRLDAMGADVTHIRLLRSVRPYNEDEGLSDEERMFRLSQDIKVLEKALRIVKDCRLIIIDPINAYLGRTDSYKDSDVRSILAPLAALAAQYNVAVIIVMHLRKSESTEPLHRVMGSIGFVAAARVVWLVAKDTENANRRLFLPAKNNLAPLEHMGLAFSIFDSAVEWESESIDMTVAEVFARDSGGYDRCSIRSEVREWIIEALSEGPVSAKEMQRLAKESGHNWRTVKRAKDAAGAESVRKGFGKNAVWYWKLIDDDCDPSEFK